MFILAYIGAYIGKRILDKIPQQLFKNIVLILIMSVGLLMVISFITGAKMIK
jgi:uncharacterized membrane protein YfcA